MSLMPMLSLATLALPNTSQDPLEVTITLGGSQTALASGCSKSLPSTVAKGKEL